MHLAEALGVQTGHEIDPTRPLKLGPFELGIEATAEAIAILGGADFPREIACAERSWTKPVYWSVNHPTEGTAEVFGFQPGAPVGLPTAIEIAIVRAIAAAQPADHARIFSGGVEIALGPPAAHDPFRRVLEVVQAPMTGTSVLVEGHSQVSDNGVSQLLNDVALKCLRNSFRTSPLKFRFLELYRVMEARFLADVKARLLANFDAEPGVSLADATEALKSELNQITGLAEAQQEAFEACWAAFDALKNQNRFVTALFRRVERKGLAAGGKWKTGAALIYQTRCAVVHAGEKDMIFENFPDGEEAIGAVLPQVERAALLLVGIEIS